MKKVFRVFLCTIFAISFLAYGYAQESYEKIYGGQGLDSGNFIHQTSDGGYIIVGSTESFGAENDDVYLLKLASNGDTLWTKTYGGTNTDIGNSVFQTSDGGYIISGYTWSFGAGADDIYVIKTDIDGDTLWTKTYGGPDGECSYCVRQTSDGGYIILGYTDSFGSGGHDVYLIKTDNQGSAVWTRTYGGSNTESG